MFGCTDTQLSMFRGCMFFRIVGVLLLFFVCEWLFVARVLRRSGGR